MVEVVRSPFVQTLFADVDDEDAYFSGFGRNNPFALRGAGKGAAPFQTAAYSPGQIFDPYRYTGFGQRPDAEVDDTGLETGDSVFGDTSFTGADDDDFGTVNLTTPITTTGATTTGATDDTGISAEEASAVLGNIDFSQDDVSLSDFTGGTDYSLNSQDPTPDYAMDANGNIVDIGYGPGEVDPSLALAAGYKPITTEEYLKADVNDIPINNFLTNTTDTTPDVAFGVGTDIYGNPVTNVIDVGYGPGEVDPALADAAGYSDPVTTSTDAITSYIEDYTKPAADAEDLAAAEGYDEAAYGGQVADSQVPIVESSYDAEAYGEQVADTTTDFSPPDNGLPTFASYYEAIDAGYLGKPVNIGTPSSGYAANVIAQSGDGYIGNGQYETAATDSGGTVSETISNVGDAISSGVSTVGETLSDIGSGVVDVATDIGEGLYEAGSAVVGAVSDTASAIGSGISDAVESISDWFSGGSDDDDDDDGGGGGGGSSGGGGGGGCFLTTAVVERRGEADNGPTLTKLRNFRDTYMANMPDIIEEYYIVAPKIVASIPKEHNDWDWIGKQVDLSVSHIDKGDLDSAFQTYKAMVEKLKKDWINKGEQNG